MRDIVVYGEEGRQGKQVAGFAILGLILGGLLVGSVYGAVVSGEWMLWATAALMGLACAGLVVAMRQKGLGRRSDGRPVLVVDQHGIGDANLRIPWSHVRAVRMRIVQRTTHSHRSGSVLANKFMDGLGVLDGSFTMEVETANAPAELPKEYRVSGSAIIFQLDRAIPSSKWAPITEAVEHYARWRGVPVG